MPCGTANARSRRCDFGVEDGEPCVASVKQELDNFMAGVERRNPHEVEFHQAVREVAASIMPWYLEHDDYRKAQDPGAIDGA